MITKNSMTIAKFFRITGVGPVMTIMLTDSADEIKWTFDSETLKS